MRRDGPVWVRVGYPEEGNVKDDEDAAQDEDWYGEQGEAGEDWAFGCLEVLMSVAALRFDSEHCSTHVARAVVLDLHIASD